jgi:hypothetical protein
MQSNSVINLSTMITFKVFLPTSQQNFSHHARLSHINPKQTSHRMSVAKNKNSSINPLLLMGIKCGYQYAFGM